MELALHEKYKNKVIYININNGYYIVYEDAGDEVAREAIRLFVQNNIDVNMPIFAYHTSETLMKNDIDVEEIISRSECKYGMKSWI